MTTTKTSPPTSFQSIILTLQHYWAEQGCVILQPYDMEMGAGTFHPATTLRALGPDHHWRAAYVQPSRRPVDGRYGENPNRLQHYYQFQVILKPSPADSQALYLGSLKAIGLDPVEHDIRFVEDDWESPTLGAAGLGWEVWCDGMEISQFTYFQQVGGIECDPVPVELTYGLERLVMFIQGVDNVYELDWDGVPKDKGGKTYGDIFKQAEREFSHYNFDKGNSFMLAKHFDVAEKQCEYLLKRDIPLVLPAYDQCMKASHLFNLFDASGAISVRERQHYISRVRALVKACCEAWPDTAGSKPRYYPVPTPAVVKPSEIPPGVRPMKGAVMAEFFIEIFSEEIPARMQVAAEDRLRQALKDGLKDIGLASDEGGVLESQSWLGPRRLAVAIRGVAERQADIDEERRGPRADAPKAAVDGFLKSAGISRKQAEVRSTPKGDFLFAVMKHKGRDAAAILPDMVSRIIGDFTWPKTMRWGEGRKGWIRPLHRVVVLFDGKPLKGAIDFGGGVRIEFGQHTEGHRVLFPVKKKGKKGGLVKLTGGEQYETALEAAQVIASRGRRREIITEALEKCAAEKGLTLIPDPPLMEEVIGLVEYPHVIMGQIDAEFRELPPEILKTTLRHHQKYFSFKYVGRGLAPFFATVANMTADKKRDATIRVGNERVLRARLADARFFWEQDLETPLTGMNSMNSDLIAMTFFEKLGTMSHKVDRIEGLVVVIADRVQLVNHHLARHAAELAKADLASQTVKEFPELQGVIGGYLARHRGEDKVVTTAIAEHYRPQGPDDAIPETPLGRVIALADKIDTLAGFFRIEMIPTGSKDPYALRRAALGVIRIIVEGKITLRLDDVMRFADEQICQHLGAEIVEIQANTSRKEEYIANFREGNQERLNQEQLSQEQRNLKRLRNSAFEDGKLMPFMYDRLKVWLRGQGFRHDIIDAAIKGRHNRNDDFFYLAHLVKGLTSLLETDDGIALLAGYKRVANILNHEEKKDGRQFSDSVDTGIFTHETERNLYQHIDNLKKEMESRMSVEKWIEAIRESENFDHEGWGKRLMQSLATLREPIDAFFDHVKVNDDDPAIRQNRLNLLAMIRNAMHEIADFSAIEGHSDRSD